MKIPDVRAYLDCNATAPLVPGVVEAMTPFLRGQYANPSSTHSFGRGIRSAVDEARAAVTTFLGARAPTEIIFTSGGTEAVQLALSLVAREIAGATWLISAIEHSAVTDAAAGWRRFGMHVDTVPVTSAGVVDVDALRTRLRLSRVALVAVMAANNETGAVQPVKEVLACSREFGALMLCDAVQLIGRSPFAVYPDGPDFVALSAHKFGGPKGTGALFLRHHDSRRLAFDRQEWGIRSGTENVAGIVGAAAALEWVSKTSVAAIAAAESAARNHLEAAVTATFPDAVLFSSETARLPNTSLFAFPGIDAAAFVERLGVMGVCVSAGAACAGRSAATSAVLEAMAVPEELRRSAVRFSTGPQTTFAEVDIAIDACRRVIENAMRTGLSC